jgi:hypothetical protein
MIDASLASITDLRLALLGLSAKTQIDLNIKVRYRTVPYRRCVRKTGHVILQRNGGDTKANVFMHY